VQQNAYAERRCAGRKKEAMYSKEYEQAKKEFRNCLFMGPLTLFVSWVLAFTEWAPVMKREKAKTMADSVSDNGIL